MTAPDPRTPATPAGSTDVTPAGSPDAPPPGPPHDTRTETHAEPPRHAAADLHDGPVHDTADHGGDQGHDDHGHEGEPLGPIDPFAWGAAALGIGIALVMAVCFALATGAIAVA